MVVWAVKESPNLYGDSYIKQFGLLPEKQSLLPILVLATGQKFYVAPSLPYPVLDSGSIEQYEARLAETSLKRLLPNPENE